MLGNASLAATLARASDAKERCQVHYWEAARLTTEQRPDLARRELEACLAAGEVCVEAQLAMFELALHYS